MALGSDERLASHDVTKGGSISVQVLWYVDLMAITKSCNVRRSMRR